MFMNEWNVDDALRRFGNDADMPNTALAVRTLDSLRDAVNRNSDGWAYWRAPQGAARKLSDLVYARLMSGMGAYREVGDISTAELRAAYSPIKAFRTKHKDKFTFQIFEPGQGIGLQPGLFRRASHRTRKRLGPVLRIGRRRR